MNRSSRTWRKFCRAGDTGYLLARWVRELKASTIEHAVYRSVVKAEHDLAPESALYACLPGGGSFDGTVLAVTNSSFSNNSAEDGGAIEQYLGTVKITDSVFSNNSAWSNSGVVASPRAAR